MTESENSQVYKLLKASSLWTKHITQSLTNSYAWWMAKQISVLFRISIDQKCMQGILRRYSTKKLIN